MADRRDAPVRRRGRRAIAAAVVVAACLVAPAGPAVAALRAGPATPAGWQDGACDGDDGVTVVVDFGALDDRTVVRCAEGAPVDALAALEQVEVTVAGTDRWGRALVCRLDGLPAADAEPCVDTPDADRSWSSWQAETTGAAWRAAGEAAEDRAPPPGSFEGWSFPTEPGDGLDATPPRIAATADAAGSGASATSVDAGGGPGVATIVAVGAVVAIGTAAAVASSRRRREVHGG